MPTALAFQHIALVHKIARLVRHELGATCVELGDLEGAGMVGLMEAAWRFDDSRGASFATFASYRIRGAMIDAARASFRLTRREKTIGTFRHLVSEQCVERECIERQDNARIAGALHALPGRERRFIQDVYFEGKLFQDSAAELGVSPSRASRIHARAVDRLRRWLDAPSA